MTRVVGLEEGNAPVVCCSLFQSPEGSSARYPVTLDDGLWVDPLRNELLGLPQELRSEHADTRCPVSNLIVLNLGDVDEDLGGGIVKLDGLENRCAIVGDVDLARGARLEDLVHALGAKSGFDEISEGEGADEGRETSILGLFLCRLLCG